MGRLRLNPRLRTLMVGLVIAMTLVVLSLPLGRYAYAQNILCFADFSRDGNMGIDELLYVLQHWGEQCGTKTDQDDLFFEGTDSVRVTFGEQASPRELIVDELQIGKTYKLQLQYTIQNLIKSQEINVRPISVNLYINGTLAKSQDLAYGLVAQHAGGGGNTIETLFTAKPTNVFRVEIDEPNAISEIDETNNSLVIARTVHASNPVDWSTPFAGLKASYFSIVVNGKVFYSNNTARVRSDPGDDQKTTLEVEWEEHGVPMRINTYFQRDGTVWSIKEIRTYDGTASPQWISYPTPPELTQVGNHLNTSFPDVIQSLNSQNGLGIIYMRAMDFVAFNRELPPPNAQGYILDPMLSEQPIVISTDPLAGFGVNVVLRDAEGEILIDQREFSYHWTVQNPEIVALTTTDIQVSTGLCLYKILWPCPRMNGQITGLRAGKTTIKVDALSSTKTVMASTEFAVEVYNH